ncbi:Aste57867_25259 [Aphanomyces stellatus]|uniref:Aste57867_25259 protein n=1 Tax=Aphanomyces stellatus TaxID=120398 RepID=A0A485LTC2_9STRA|nr:hypothetical protein As57867_025181 [Aphanomyces stellatus]VFU01885.1 Aste57867_25259 [Aphanomyces stellatus]
MMRLWCRNDKYGAEKGSVHGTASDHSSSATTTSGKRHAIEAGSKDKKRDIYSRLVINLFDISIATLLLMVQIGLSVAGQWSGHITTMQPPTLGTWTTFGQPTCLLTATGFQSCGDSPPTTALSWTALGATVAKTIGGLSNATVPVTQCAIGLSRGYGIVVFLVGTNVSSSPPSCLPTSSNVPLTAMTLLETAWNDDTNAVNYLVSTYVDTQVAPATEDQVDTGGGASTVLSSHLTKVFISDAGMVVSTPPTTSSWRFQTTPFLPRYRFDYGCVSQVVSPSEASGGHVGATSGRALVVGRTCSHTVHHSDEVAIAMYVGIFIMTHLLNGDLVATLVGIRGVLLHQPVLTYDLLSGLERRRVFVCLVGFCRLSSLWYLEAARVAHDSTFGTALFYLISTMATGLLTLAVFWLVVAIQHLPAISCFRGKIIRLFAPLFHIGTVFLSLVVVGASNGLGRVTDALWLRPHTSLPLQIQNQTIASGAYDVLDVPPCIQLLAPDYLVAVIAMTVLAALVPIVFQRCLLVDIAFVDKNDFLSHEFIPRYLTFLPLYESECVKYGNKFFVRASTVALFGYGVLEEAETSAIEVKPAAGGGSQTATSFVLVQVYDLVAALLPHKLVAPALVGVIHNYHFEKSVPGTHLRKSTRYRLSKGSPVS